MSFRNVADRAAFLNQQFATNLTLLTKDSEVVRLLEDRTGGGRADHSEIIADGFNSVVDGTAAGVLATEDAIYFANIPSLWRIDRVVSPNPPSPRPSPPGRGGDALPLAAPSPGGEGRGEGGPRSRSADFLLPTQLATGFGVHIGVSGHDCMALSKDLTGASICPSVTVAVCSRTAKAW